MINFDFAPASSVAPGTYTNYFNMVAEGVGFMSCSTACLNWTVTVGYFQACYVGQSNPAPTGGIFVPGDSYQASVTYSNCGTNEWWPNSLPRLAASSPQWRCSVFAGSSWEGCNISTLVWSYTAPNSTYTFTYTLYVGCKQAAGTYTEYFQPVADTVTWMSDQTTYHLTLNVGKIPDVSKCVL